MTQSDNSILIDWKKNYAFIMTKICKQQMLENPKPLTICRIYCDARLNIYTYVISKKKIINLW